MSEDSLNVATSELQADSEILGMELCVDDDDNWVIRVEEGTFLTAKGDIVYEEDGVVPSEAVFSSVIKAQGAVQEHADSIEITDSNTDEQEIDEKETQEKNKTETEEEKNEDTEDESDEDKEFEEDAVLFVDESEEETDDIDFDEIEEDEDGEDMLDEEEELFSQPEGVDTSEKDSPDVQEEEDDEGLMDKVSGLLGSDDEEDAEDEYSDFEENQQDSVGGNVREEGADDGLMSKISSLFESEEEPDSVESEGRETEDESDEREFKGDSQEVQDGEPEENENVPAKEQEGQSSGDGMITKVKELFETDNKKEEQDLMKEDEKEPLLEKTKLFFSAEIAEVDQDRPDAQNVSIDFIDREPLAWSQTMKNFWGKLRKASEGDESVQKDLKTDVWTREFALFKRNSYARGDILDFIFMFSLAVLGLLIIAIGIGASLTGNIRASEVLNQTSSYGDHMMITTIILAVASISFWLSRRVASETVVSAVRKPARTISGLILGIQLLVGGYVGYALTLGGGQDALLAIELAMDDTMRSVGAFLNSPPAVPLNTGVGDALLEVYFSYRGAENTVFGLSITEASVFMVVVGLITAYPVLKRSIARFILTANMGPREFREETGILAEQISDADEPGEYEGPRYVMGGNGSDGEANVTSEGEGQSVVTQQEAYGQIELSDDEETEGLLALPENVKGSPFKNYEEVRRYWVRAPYAYVSIVYNERQNDYRYVVVEPELDESEKVIFDELNKRLDTVLLFEDVEEKEDHEEEQKLKLQKLEKKMIELSDEYDIDINDETFHRLMYYIERDYVYYNKIDPLINDPNVEDISCDGEDQYIFVFHSDYKDIITNVKFGTDELRSFIQELAQRSGEHISAADPMVDASLPDGSRAQMTLGTEVTTHGSTFTIRLFEDIPFTPVDLLDYDTFSLTQMAYLWTAIEHNKSLIFAGGTASGKTTSMNAVSMFIPPKAKVITIEDTREISLPQKNWIPGTTREGVGGEEGGDDIDMYELLRAALRQRPEYIVVGEIRGREAETLFQAMNTGHTTYSTMHAETVDAAIGRLTNPPINVPKQMITALDIICIQNQIRFTDEDGNAVNVRRNEETREIVSLRDNGQFENRRPFQWDAETDTFIQSLEDSHVLARIAEENGWTPEDKRRELKQREEVLEYMLEENIREFEYVSNIIQSYMVDPEKIVREVREDTLEPSELKSLTDMEWEEPDESLNELASGDEEEAQAAQEAGDDL